MRLIDADALTKNLMKMRNKMFAGTDEYFLGQKAGLMKGFSVVMTFPTVEERKHGHWKNGCCTVCGESAATDGHFDFIAEEEQKCCWNCGAIMDGEEND